MAKHKVKKIAEPVVPTEITDALLVLSYEGETLDSAEKISREAELISGKIERKGRKAAVCRGGDEFARVLNNSANKTLQKIHVVAHGNWEVVGNYNAAPLATFIAPLIQNKNNLQKITLHSCMAGAIHPTQGQIFAQQFAAALVPLLTRTQMTRLVIRGSDGRSFTDSTGRNWVLNEDAPEPNYRATAEAEQQYISANTQERKGAARPKFIISRKTTQAGFGQPIVA